MKKTKRFAAFIAIFALLIAMFAGCSAAGSAEPEAPAEEAPAAESKVEKTEEKQENEAAPAAAPAEAKTFSVAISENMTELHPLNQATLPGKAIMYMVYDTLVSSDHEGGFYPLLAKDWSISEDGKVWSFNLQENVTFHNGEKFDAEDVVSTFQIILDNPDTLTCSTQYWAILDSVEATGEYSVDVTLKEETAAGIVLMGFANTFIIPNEAYAEMGDSMFTDQKLSGTGPWIFDEWLDGQYVHLLKNEEYWGDLDSAYDDFYMRFILEPATAVNAHLSGTVNAYITTGGVDPDLVSLYNGYESTIDVFQKSCGTFEYIGMQCAGAFKDKNVRLAFEHAIDREIIMNAVFGGGFLPSSILPDSCFGYDASLENYKYDPELAKQELADSTYDGSEIVLASNAATAKSETILLAMSEMLNEVGFNTTVSIVEGATLLEMRSTGEFDAFLVSWSHNFGDPYMFLNQRVMLDVHHTNYSNDRVSELIKLSSSETDDAVRAEQIAEAVALMREDAAPYYPVVGINSTFAIDRGVEGIDLYSDGIFDFRNVDYSAS